MPPRKKTVTTTTSLTEMKVEKPSSEKNQITSLETLRSQTTKEVNTIIDLLISQINKFEQTKKQTQEEIITKEKQNRQTEEEKQFNNMMDQKKKQAEFDEKLATKIKEFEEKKSVELAKLETEIISLDEKKDEFENLKKQVSNFPSELEKAIDEAKKMTISELKKDFDAEKKFLIQKTDYDLKLIQQQLLNLQQTVKQQEKEIQSLKEEKSKAIEQINQLAVTVIKGKETPSIAPSHED